MQTPQTACFTQRLQNEGQQMKERMRVGAKAAFLGMECEVRQVISDHYLCLTMPIQDGCVQLPPLYTQGECFLELEENMYRTLGEVVERYKKDNCFLMDVELLEGMYLVEDPKLPKEMLENPELSIEEQKKLVENAILQQRNLLKTAKKQEKVL